MTDEAYNAIIWNPEKKEAAKRLKNLRLKAARVGCDLSQEELAAKVGVTRQTIGMIEAGRFIRRWRCVWPSAGRWASRSTTYSGMRRAAHEALSQNEKRAG